MRFVEGDYSNMGNPASDPGAFVVDNTVAPREYMVSINNSWRGKSNPTGAFAGQHGNRMHFVLHVKGNGTVRFKYEDITWQYYGGDAPWGSTRRIGSPAEEVDCTHGWGYDWGNDRVKGGTDDTKVCNTGNTTLVDELFYAGPGFGLTSDRCFTEPSYHSKCNATTGFTHQQVLHWYCDTLNNSSIDNPMGMQFTITGSDSNTYTYTAKRSNPGVRDRPWTRILARPTRRRRPPSPSSRPPSPPPWPPKSSPAKS